MTSVGVMASAVVTSTAVDVLLENFTSVAEWDSTFSPTSVTGGRTGNAGQVIGSNSGRFHITAPNQSADLTIGFAYKVSALPSTRLMLQLISDTDTNVQTTVQVATDGSIVVRLGGTAGTVLGTTAAGLVVANTYVYIEVQVTLHATTGKLILRVNGTTALNLSGINTVSGGTALFETIRILNGGAGSTSLYDDLYLTMGAGAPFKGDITVP